MVKYSALSFIHPTHDFINSIHSVSEDSLPNIILGDSVTDFVGSIDPHRDNRLLKKVNEVVLNCRNKLSILFSLSLPAHNDDDHNHEISEMSQHITEIFHSMKTFSDLEAVNVLASILDTIENMISSKNDNNFNIPGIYSPLITL